MFLILPGGSGGEGDDAGQCPAASALSEAECAGAVSTCWSPGQRDTDCPDNGLCCVSRTNTIPPIPLSEAKSEYFPALSSLCNNILQGLKSFNC